MLALVRGTTITNVKNLESASHIIVDAQIRADEIEVFAASLREKVQHAAARFQEIPGFEDFEVTLTIRKWGLKSMLSDAIRNLKNSRANFMAEEERKLKQKQLDAQAEQDRKNREDAQKAAEAARKAGADKATVAEIKKEVLSTPAPIIESKTANVAANVGASFTYRYYAKVVDLRKFLTTCLTNETMFNTLKAAIPEIEAQFRTTAQAQKENFNYSGITFDKRPGDRQS
jgi:hypothetical protein